MWWLSGRVPERPSGGFIGHDTPVDSGVSGQAALDFSAFEWKGMPPASGNESFVLTIWAADPAGTRGRQLFTHSAHAPRLEVAPEMRATWPDVLIWRVDRVDSSGLPSFGPEWRAQRAPH